MLEFEKDIRDSAELLGLVIDSISSAVFIIDENYNVTLKNSAFTTMFDSYQDNPIDKFCGEDKRVLNGNYFSLDDKGESGKQQKGVTNDKEGCILRRSIDTTLRERKIIEKKVFERIFITAEKKEKKYFVFTTKPITIKGKNHVLIVIDDITYIQKIKSELIDRNEIIDEYNKKFNKELELAKRVQRSIVSLKMVEHKDYVINSRYFPLGALGGDMYDYFVIDDTKIGVLMCDVIGHGIAASLVTTMIKAILESSKALLCYPNKFVKKLNQSLMNIANGFYLSLIYGVIDVESSQFKFVRAGHPYPVVIRDCCDIFKLKQTDNFILGMDSDYDFSEESIVLKKDDKLLLYTDGLVEVGDKDDGHEDMVFDILKNNAAGTGEEILNALEINLKKRMLNSVRKDDVCMVMIRKN